MKEKEPDIQDIYRSKELPSERDPRPKIPELMESEVRRRRTFALSGTVLLFILVVFITRALIIDFLFKPEPPVVEKKTPYFAIYDLPINETWALDYRQTTLPVDKAEPVGPKPISLRWIKNVAYHIIVGEEALRQNALEAAQYHFEIALATFPELTGVHDRLGLVYLKQQKFELTVGQLEQALKEASSVVVLNNLGAAYIGLQQYERAKGLLHQALQQKPDLTGCYKNLAFLYQKTGHQKKAQASFEKYFAVYPQDTALIQSYVNSLILTGQRPAAITFLEQLTSAEPLPTALLLARTAAQDNDPEKAVRALYNAARLLTPRQTIAEMHDAAFEKIARTEPFEALLNQLEIATVSLSTNLNTKGTPH